jgi:hypothetical protein
MAGWKQVSGDMSWERHGVVLAHVDPRAGQAELVRIIPWIEHDHEAAVTHGLYLVDSTTLDFADLEPDSRTVQDALQSAGISVDEYNELAPEHRADLLASYAGYPDTRSANKLAKALPAPVDEIEFWGGRETANNLKDYDADLRREVLEANFETRMTFGVMPESKALHFALGGEKFHMKLVGEDELAFAYATTLADVSGQVDTAEDLEATIRALAEAPPPAELPAAKLHKVRHTLSEWEDHYGDPNDEESGIANAAQSLAASMLETLGFEWV